MFGLRMWILEQISSNGISSQSKTYKLENRLNFVSIRQAKKKNEISFTKTFSSKICGASQKI